MNFQMVDMARTSFISTTPEPERALLVGIDWKDGSWPVDRSLDELERLAHTAGAVTVARMTQKLFKPYPKTFLGSGKVNELVGLVQRLNVDVVIFDEELTPSQQSNLEKAVGEPVKIIDRTALILDIFGLHARTREGRLQVQLAQCEYLLPRLRGMWSHLAKEQTRGGIGGRFGQGESQLEVDRRLVRNRISALKRDLKEVEKRRGTQSKRRVSSSTFRVALVGYTNAGKSSILNRVTDAGVLSQDKLFATLDPTTRSYALEGGRTVTITDTVGFIHKLPHGLVNAFTSTLSEAIEADLILKVVDASDDNFPQQLDAVDHVLEEIKADKRPMLTVFNKIDLLDGFELLALQRRNPDAIFISAETGVGIDRLLERIGSEAAQNDILVSLFIPYVDTALVAEIHRQGSIMSEDYRQDGIAVVAKIPKALALKLKRFEVTDLKAQ